MTEQKNNKFLQSTKLPDGRVRQVRLPRGKMGRRASGCPSGLHHLDGVRVDPRSFAAIGPGLGGWIAATVLQGKDQRFFKAS